MRQKQVQRKHEINTHFEQQSGKRISQHQLSDDSLISFTENYTEDTGRGSQDSRFFRIFWASVVELLNCSLVITLSISQG